MHALLVYNPRRANAAKRVFKRSIFATMIGVLLLAPASPPFFHAPHVRLLLSFLGGLICISALRDVLALLLEPGAD